MMENEVGRRIRELRKMYNVSRDVLAQRLDISMSHMGLIERGERGTSLQRYTDISSMFNVTLDYLLAGRGEIHEMKNYNLINLEGLLGKHELRRLTEFAVKLSRYRHTQGEVDLLFDACFYQLNFLHSLHTLNYDASD